MHNSVRILLSGLLSVLNFLQSWISSAVICKAFQAVFLLAASSDGLHTPKLCTAWHEKNVCVPTWSHFPSCHEQQKKPPGSQSHKLLLLHRRCAHSQVSRRRLSKFWLRHAHGSACDIQSQKIIKKGKCEPRRLHLWLRIPVTRLTFCDTGSLPGPNDFHSYPGPKEFHSYPCKC